MIEATCTACGNVNRVSDGDIPVGARFVTCTTCKARVAIPTKTGAMAAVLPPGIDAAAPGAAQAAAAALENLDLADLPAPRTKTAAAMQRAAAQAPEPPRTATSARLVEAFDPELPAPRTATKRAVAPVPQAQPPGTFELDDFLASEPPAGGGGAGRMNAANMTDLPAPRAAIPAPSRAPQPPPLDPTLRGSGIVDLPAPKVKGGAPRPPSEPAGGMDLPMRNGGHALDLPTPKTKQGGAATRPHGSGAHDFGAPIVDLPTPKHTLGDNLPMPRGQQGVSDLPMPRGQQGVSDLPMPRGQQGVSDLPMPRGQQGVSDLPMPKAGGGVGGLPMPKQGYAPGGHADLPMPRGQQGIVDLPAPRHGGVGDLPMPKPGQIGDLPTPKPGGAGDLPAPKGFFNDLPQPAMNQGGSQLPAPKGFFDDLPARPNKPQQGGSELPAPKGFFEDLPGRPNQARADKPEVPAPKGFFDDLPGRPNQAKPEVPAPKGFFDDLPGRVNPSKPEVPAPKGYFEDLPRPAPGHGDGAEPLELDSSALELEGGGLELEPSTDDGAGKFDALDLAAPTAPTMPAAMGASAGLRISTPARPAGGAPNPYGSPAERGVHGTFPPANVATDAVLELEEPRPAPRQESQKLGSRAGAGKGRFDPVAAERRRKRLMIALLSVVLLGGVGFFGYRYMQKRAAKAEQQEIVDAQVAAARAALGVGEFDKAHTAITKIVQLDEEGEIADAAARGLGAEASFASHLAKGTTGALARGAAHLSKARDLGLSGPEIERAKVIQTLTMNQPDIAKLQALANAAPKDGVSQLYAAWGHMQLGNYADAIKAFDTAATATPTIKIYALYGRGRAHLALGKISEARDDFNAILKLKEGEEHIGAMVGLAETIPVTQTQERENESLAILARKNIAAADPRAVAMAWVLAADAARESGRLDVARERYRKALELDPNDVTALTGLAETELRDGKLDTAAEMITKATTLSKDNVRAQLCAADIEIRQKRIDVAAQRIQILSERNPPPPLAELARLKLIHGRLFEAQNDDKKAADMYVAAAKLAKGLDLTPTLAAVSKLTELQTKDAANADKYKDIADELLGKLADEAQKDLRLALTLGIAYLQNGDPLKAEPWLRHVTENQRENAEAHYHYGKALAALGKFDDAILHLKAAIKLDAKRSEFGLELARIYETAAKDAEAAAQYGELLEGKDLPLELRARACRFYARTGKVDKAAEQGNKIAEKSANHPAGQFCKAEGLLAAGRIEDAKKLYSQAADTDRDPQYFDGLGRALEKMAVESGDPRLLNQAIKAYEDAIKLAPLMRHPSVGKARIHVSRREDEAAVKALADVSKQFPEDGEIAFLLGAAYKELSKTGGPDQVKLAIQWLDLSLRYQPRGEAAWLLGILYVDTDKAALAVQAWSKAVDLHDAERKKKDIKDPPWLPEALFKLGRLNMDLRNERAAKGWFDRFMALKPTPTGSMAQEAQKALSTTLKQL